MKLGPEKVLSQFLALDFLWGSRKKMLNKPQRINIQSDGDGPENQFCGFSPCGPGECVGEGFGLGYNFEHNRKDGKSLSGQFSYRYA